MKAFLFLIFTLFGTFPAQAAQFYLEVGAGIDKFISPDAFYPSLTRSPGLGYTFNGMIGAYLFGGPSSNVQLGIKAIASQAGTDTQEINLAVPVPMLRLEFWRFYVGAGLTPYVWSRTSDTLGLDYFRLESGTLAGVLEAGLMWKILPDFSLNLEGSGLFVKSDRAGLSPKPVAALTLQFRFLFSIGKPMKESGGNKFDGWRYPFGFGR